MPLAVLQIYMNDYFPPISLLQREMIFFTCSLEWTTYDVYHLWFLSSHGEFLGVWLSIFLIFWSTLRFPTRENRDAITVLYLLLYI